MPVYKLLIKCDLENIKNMTPIPGNLWKFNISSSSSSSCGDLRNGITVSKEDVIELEGSKGTANFILRWSKSEPQSYIKVVPIKKVSGLYTETDSGKWVPILGLECRGIELLEFIPSNDFDVETIGGTKFQTVDLTEKEWSEYDEENDISLISHNSDEESLQSYIKIYSVPTFLVKATKRIDKI